MLLAGVDEAGRGPVLGSMVMCGVVIDNALVAKLEVLGVKDSKDLTAKIREELYDRIIAVVKDYHVVVVDPVEIDAALESQTLNLNKLEANKTIEIIEALKPNKIIIDCPDRNLESYKEYLFKRLEHETELIVQHRAEEHAVVAAASVIAKVIRDRKMKELSEIHGLNFGSGYASDPNTKKFIAEHWDNPNVSHIIRKSWATYKNIKEKNEQTSLSGF